MPVDYSAPMPPLVIEAKFRDYVLDLAQRFYVDSWRNCATQLGLQTGIDVELLHRRGSSPHGEFFVEFLTQPQTDLVNLCVKNWNDAISRSKNPGIPHSEIAVPVQYASPIFAELLDRDDTLEVDMPHLFGVERHFLQRIARGTVLTCEGSLYYQAVKVLAGAISKHPREIIKEPTIYALSAVPTVVYVQDPSDQEQDHGIIDEARVYSFEHIRQAALRPSIVTMLWREFESAESRGDQLDIIVSMAELLKPKAGIREEDVALSLQEFYGAGLRLPEAPSKPARKNSGKMASDTNGDRAEPVCYLPVLWAQEQAYQDLLTFRPATHGSLGTRAVSGLSRTDYTTIVAPSNGVAHGQRGVTSNISHTSPDSGF